MKPFKFCTTKFIIRESRKYPVLSKLRCILNFIIVNVKFNKRNYEFSLIERNGCYNDIYD